MTISELIKALRSLKIQTNSFACLGCGHEHNCGIHGCAIIREAAEKLGYFNTVFPEDAVLKLAGQCLKVEPGRLRELAEADKDGRLELSEFERHYECNECDAKWATECNACHEEGKIKRPPQSWCYVEEG